MFQSIGWGEIFVVLLLALIVIGPERLPTVVTDVRAAIFAARKAINNAKKEMNGEFGEEFEEFRKPIAEVAKWRSMTPRAALSHALFADDEELLDSFDPKKIMAQETAGQAYRESRSQDQAGEKPNETSAGGASQGTARPVSRTGAQPQTGRSQHESPQPAQPRTVERRRLGSAARPTRPRPSGTQGRDAGAVRDFERGPDGFSWDDIM